MGVLYPRCWLSINGAPIPCISAKVTKTSKRSAGTFSADLSITETTSYGMALSDWADYQPNDVEILMSTAAGGADQTSMIIGQIDEPKINWETMIVSVSGRDKTANLIENRRSQKFPNQMSSDIVSTIASANGLTPKIVASSAFAGKQYNDGDTSHLAIHRTDFEIISDLADREGYRWYVDGANLVFEPKDQQNDVFSAYWAPPGVVAPYGVASVLSLSTSRNMTAAKPHTVNVKSWHDKDGKQYNGAATAPGVGNPINIDHHHNRKQQDQVDKLAMSRAMDAIRHDCSVTVKAPIDLTVGAYMQLQLDGTGTIYDQTYDIDQVDFDVSWGSGGELEIKAKAAKNGRSVSNGGASDGADSAPGDPRDS